MRPAAITVFERLYLAALVVSVVAAIANWSGDVRALLARPEIAQMAGAGRLVPVVYPVTRIVIWAAWLLLWFLVARRGSGVARLFVAIGALVVAYDAIGVLLALASTPLSGWGATATLIEAALLVSAAAMLFRPSARPWFRRGARDTVA